MNSFHGTVPSENWDDDFEFQPPQTKHPNANSQTKHAHDHLPNRMSIASSDWDVAHDDDEDEDEDKDETKAPTILEDKKNLTHWAEQLTPATSTTPQTPTRRAHAPTKSTENWDDDFEDSPVRSQHASPSKAFPPPPQAKSPSKHTKRKAGRPESWDDEFGGPAAGKASPGRQLASPESSDDERELGYAIDGEEDRTVTARSRRAALSRLTSTTNTPPPPVPMLPLSLPFLDPTQGQGFPRSPTASVFSIPTQRPPSTTSTTYLRPTMSRSSSRLDALPPSPPIHRERERRRLRKKSRPVPQGAIEMTNLGRSRRDDEYAFEEEDGEEEAAGRRSTDSRPLSPEPHPGVGTSYSDAAGPSSLPAGTPPGTPLHVPPSTPNGKGGALLSRIGSVKKWGVRRKRGGSVTPAEVLAGPGAGVRIDTDPSSHYTENDVNLTPRPRPHSQASSSFPSSGSESHSSNNHSGSASSLHYHTHHGKSKRASTSPQTQTQTSNTNWFFRSSSSPLAASGSNTTTGFALGTGSNSSGDLSVPAVGQNHNSKDSREFPHPRALPPQPETPTKLVKRKSLGFVQLRLGFGGHGDDSQGGSGAGGDGGRYRDEKEKGDEKGKRPASIVPPARHVSYGGLGMGRAGGSGNGAERGDEFMLGEYEKERMREAEREREKEGSRGFIGSVRKISLVGRHKRTKSGVSLLGVEELAGVRQPRSSIPPTPHLHPQDHLKDHPDRERTPQPKHFNTGANGNPLLPPIELQPPSPPRARPSPVQTRPLVPMSTETENMLSPGSSSASSLTVSPTSPTSPSRRAKTPGSPQAASLGRSTIGLSAGAGTAPAIAPSGGTSAAVLRRNSLGDLKIPDRISQAQVGLRRDLGMVREFAANVEQLKELQTTYHTLVCEVQGILDNHMLQSQAQQQQVQPRAMSPSFLQNLSRPMSRHRSHTNPTPPTSSSSSLPTPPATAPTNPNSYAQMAIKQLASSFYTINSKYRISWECAELLIELGGGTSGNNESSSAPPSTSASAPAMHSVVGGVGGSQQEIRKASRERAITLAGDESKPPTPTPGATSTVAAGMRAVSPPLASPPSLAWRASTGRHDLSHRQLVLLKEMLNHADSASSFADDVGSGSIPEESFLPPSSAMLSVNREWRWGDAMSSTVTLPSEDSGPGGGGSAGGISATNKKRRSSRLGMSGLRDMLRSLKRSHSENPPLPTTMVVPSSASLSADNSSTDHRYPHTHIPPTQGRRRAKTSSGPESVRIPRPTTPYSPSSLTTKPSPRRPSLASIFRLGQKNKAMSPTVAVENGENDMHPRSVGSRSASGSSAGEEEDWDRMDSASDLDAAARALGIGHDGSATVRGKGLGRSPYLQDSFPPPLPGYPIRPLTPKRSASGSQSSLWGGESPSHGGTPPPLPPSRSTRLSNVEEHMDGQRQVRSSSKGRHSKVGVSPSRPMSRGTKNGSVRSMPPQSASGSLPDPKLAMTPENIKPLLENAKDVHARLNECIAEIRSLLSLHAQ